MLSTSTLYFTIYAMTHIYIHTYILKITYNTKERIWENKAPGARVFYGIVELKYKFHLDFHLVKH